MKPPGTAGPLAFRKATVDDVAEVVALVNSAYRGDSSRAGWTTEADFLDGQRTDADALRELIESEGSMILLCLQGGRLAGSVHLERDGPDAYLGMFVVKPTLQGAGIGKIFMAAAEQAARDEWGATRMSMQVITLRAELIAFYERRGYRRTGVLRPFPTDPRFGQSRVGQLEFEVLEKVLGP